jgi:hypothetical protein
VQQSEKLAIFETELSYIENEDIRKFTGMAIRELPDYFFKIPASTSRKYHPEFAAGEGGLVRHTKGVVRIAKELFRLEMFEYFSHLEKDLILSSLILHDGIKAGVDGLHTVANHPLLMADFLRTDEELGKMLPTDQIEMISENIAKHMGEWTSDYRTGEVILEKPNTKMQNFCHLCDYLASRKCIEMNLDAPLSS